MPRRPPPSSLRLHTGPTPPRSAPKHVMPSVPRPTFCPPASVARPIHRSRHSEQLTCSSATTPGSRDGSPVDGNLADPFYNLSQLSSTGLPSAIFTGLPDNSSKTSLSTPSTSSSGTTRRRSGSDSGQRPVVVRGPWDHSGCITSNLEFDVETVLAPPKPVIVGP